MMANTKRKRNSIVSMKWLVFPSLILILTLFGGLRGQDVLPNTSSPSIAYSIDAHQGASERINGSDLSTFHNIFGDFEIEVEDEKHSSNRRSYKHISPSLGLHKITSVSYFRDKKTIKLFILFHSWKSFLPI